jgi:hypothetical protein
MRVPRTHAYTHIFSQDQSTEPTEKLGDEEARAGEDGRSNGEDELAGKRSREEGGEGRGAKRLRHGMEEVKVAMGQASYKDK